VLVTNQKMASLKTCHVLVPTHYVCLKYHSKFPHGLVTFDDAHALYLAQQLLGIIELYLTPFQE
jgi:hypothetical protein